MALFTIDCGVVSSAEVGDGVVNNALSHTFNIKGDDVKIYSATQAISASSSVTLDVNSNASYDGLYVIRCLEGGVYVEPVSGYGMYISSGALSVALFRLSGASSFPTLRNDGAFDAFVEILLIND